MVSPHQFTKMVLSAETYNPVVETNPLIEEDKLLAVLVLFPCSSYGQLLYIPGKSWKYGIPIPVGAAGNGSVKTEMCK